MASSAPASVPCAIAAHRFGLGERTLDAVGADARAWLLAQIGPAQPQQGHDLPSGAECLRRINALARQRRAVRQPALVAPAGVEHVAERSMAPDVPATITPTAPTDPLREVIQADLRARLATAVLSPQPFNERLALFWANHFTVSTAKGSARGLAGAFEREAIRPHIAGSFETLLVAAVTHAGMLRYLDNDNSAGPDARVVQRLARRAGEPGQPRPRLTGLNENLAREVLELHTLGVDGGYTQADVTQFARVLTGWRVPLPERYATSSTTAADPGTELPAQGRFDPAWHQPGPKTVLGRHYPEGPDALGRVLHDLAHHRSTARFVATKLARHFVADEPPAALVARLEADFVRTQGDLPSLYRTLVDAPEAWSPAPSKLKTPEEFVISSARVLGLGEIAARQNDAGIGALGQRVQAAPSPAGWPDQAPQWLGPDAVWKRVEWAARIGQRMGRLVDARALARASLGPWLQDETRRQIDRAEDGTQALALLLLAPEFQRR